jgi:DNA modification methylase|tara:strand:+ start:282 stop:1208 length:927 start_codon:yes stop_codon:yes gene_type:complete
MAKVDTILQGDVIERLKDIEDNTIQCVVTSPPYWGLRDYGEDNQLGLEETPEEYVENMVNVFREVRRTLKDDGTLWLNLGDSYNTTQAGNKTWGDGVGSNKQYAKGIIPKKRNKTLGLKPKDLVGIPWRVAFALQQDGWYLRQDIIWHKPNPMPESVTDRCTKSHEYIFLMSKSANYYYDAESIKEKTITNDNINRDRETTRLNNTPGRTRMEGLKTNNYEKRNKRSVWKINTKPYKEAHFAVFPEKLPELCIKAGSKEGDIVLDPFFGSGTTGFVAQRLYRKWIGIELNPEYIKIANKRFVQQELFV